MDGYYNRRPADDYFTSPAVHPAFGALLAILVHRTWMALGCPAQFTVVELAAGDGRLARDFTSYASEICPEFAGALAYIAVDRAAYRFDQSELRSFEIVRSNDIPLRGIVGCVLSNELVDALPVHRFEMRDGTPKEVYVTLDGGELVEVLEEPSTPQIPERLSTLGRRLPDGFRGEVNLGIRPLMQKLSEALDRGLVVTIDYGHEIRELYSPIRAAGTLQTYLRHAHGSSLYRQIGRQDMTSHVDFTTLVAEGTAAGLQPVGLTSQREALGALGVNSMLSDLSRMGLRSRGYSENRVALEELVRVDGLGGFKWLIQEKETGLAEIDEVLNSHLRCPGCADLLPVPLSGGKHIDLARSRYPGATTELTELWPPGE